MMGKLTVMELLRYYVDRYDLPTDATGNVDEVKGDGLKPYHTKVTRILKETPIGEITLWDAIKPEKGKRRISIEEFEKLCFPRWRDYIRINYADCYDAGALQADEDRYRAWFEGEKRWEIMASEQAEQVDQEYRAGLFELNLNDDDDGVVDFSVPYEKVRSKGCEMMLEAIYDAFFERFDWKGLKEDMDSAEILDANAGDPAFYTADLVKAKTRLKSYRNYVGNRRSD